MALDLEYDIQVHQLCDETARSIRLCRWDSLLNTHYCVMGRRYIGNSSATGTKPESDCHIRRLKEVIKIHATLQSETWLITLSGASIEIRRLGYFRLGASNVQIMRVIPGRG